jgi:hypothetical protein
MWEKLKPFPTKSKKEARVSTFPILIQHSAEGFQIRKEEVKLSLSADDMILYLKYCKSSTQKLLELINIFSNDTKSICKKQ